MTTPTLPHPYPPQVAVSSEARQLAAQAATAAELFAYQRDPDVVALHVERFRTQVDYLMWAGIVLGLCFTMTNVQQFAAADALTGSLAWFSAWLLDPMVSLVLLAVLRAEQVTTRYQVHTGMWPRIAKWALLSATYVMNTWVYWAAGSAAGVVLHSVPPVVVVLAAEAITDVQYALSECVQRAHTAAAHHGRGGLARQAAEVNGEAPGGAGPLPSRDERSLTTSGEPFVTVDESPVNSPGEPTTGQVRPLSARSPERATPPRPTPHRKPVRRGRVPVRRKLFADYLAEARAAWRPGVVVSPAWVRQVTDCSRGLSSKLAATLTREHPTGHNTSSGSEFEGRAA
jgi:hypothetical protein